MAGVSWDDVKPSGERPRSAAALALASLLAVALVPVQSAAGQGDIAAPAQGTVDVIVRGAEDRELAEVARAVEDVGGAVERELPIVNGVAAELPAASIDTLRRSSGVAAVTTDVPLDLLQTTTEADTTSTTTTGVTVRSTATHTALDALWSRGLTGAGVTVALVDSGTADVAGLSGRVLDGPDLSLEADTTPRRDTYGHGTHMAGLIVGKDTGVAPGARLVSVKVADAEGRTDVSQVIAALDWVVTEKRRGAVDTDVLVLAFGTDARVDHATDPLSYAVEAAWRAGIVVVVSVGNAGSSLGRLNHPATVPAVIAVGAADLTATRGRSLNHVTVPGFSSRGDGVRDPDLVAPGVSMVSLRAPGSTADRTHPGARVGTDGFRGSGTSQAAAYAAGVAALLLEADPSITPDRLKGALVATAGRIGTSDVRAAGAGLVRGGDALWATSRATGVQRLAATGGGLLERSRGTHHLVKDGVRLQGEVVVGGDAFDSTAWARGLADGTNWTVGSWSGSSWSGSSWSGSSWSGSSWSGSSWSGSSWSGSSWSTRTWG
jgi:hypothetical protein